MKIAVIGDTHLGANFSNGRKDHRTGRNTRLLDYAKTLEDTLIEVSEKGCEILIFTGDIFEHRHPNVLYQKIFSEKLRYALSLGIREIHIVIGNHDQQRQNTATTISYLQKLELDNIVVHDELSYITVNKNNEDIVNIIFMPYRDRKWYGVDTYEDGIMEMDKELRYQMATIKNDAPKILVGHMTIEGTFFASEDADLYSDNELFLPKMMFRDIDITLMGHVHHPYVVSEHPYIAYVGSMEKRGAFEDHDKVYAVLDTVTRNLEFCKEPCREIFDIKLDFSGSTEGILLQEKINKRVEIFSHEHNLAGSIVRVILAISADDVKFCNHLEVEELLRDTYNVNYCVPIKPQLFFSRQARDSQITENSTDSSAFSRYLKNVIDDRKLCKKINDKGLEIILSAGGE